MYTLLLLLRARARPFWVVVAPGVVVGVSETLGWLYETKLALLARQGAACVVRRWGSGRESATVCSGLAAGGGSGRGR